MPSNRETRNYIFEDQCVKLSLRGFDTYYLSYQDDPILFILLPFIPFPILVHSLSTITMSTVQSTTISQSMVYLPLLLSKTFSAKPFAEPFPAPLRSLLNHSLSALVYCYVSLRNL